MKKIVLPISLFFLLSSNLHAQVKQSKKLFAITGEVKGSYKWNTVREINAVDGSLKNTLYAPANNQAVAFKSATFKSLPVDVSKSEATATNVAATAYDAVNNRLYYTNMRTNDLRYFDLNEKDATVYSNDDPAFNTGDKFSNEASIITRMAFGSDGYGYAISNDAEHLIRFSTSAKPEVVDLGAIRDGNSAPSGSIHNQCSGWGGDIVGDANGNLYLINMRNNVYKINIETKVADFIGGIKGLPAEFTTNGAAVDENGDLIVSSAVYTKSYFKVNPQTFEVTEPIATIEGVLNASDLASSNLLYKKSSPEVVTVGRSLVSVYPNPIVGESLNVKFENVATGKYLVTVEDLSGRIVSQKSAVFSNGQVAKLNVPSSMKQGAYIIKVTDSNKNSVYSNKLIVE